MVCKECVDIGFTWDGEPTGKEVDLNGIKAYVAMPAKETHKAVILASGKYLETPVLDLLKGSSRCCL